jgi:hypothetical protein
MITYNWNKEKNLLLKETREISFEQIVMHIEQGDLIDIIGHPNSEKYSHQKILIINVKNYIYTVPFIENENERFLKTIIPNRKFTKKYLGGQNEKL